MTPRTDKEGFAGPKSPGATQTNPGTKTPAAGKPGGRATLVTPTSKQGGGSPGDERKKDDIAEDGGTGDGGATRNKKRTADGAGKRVQQWLEYSAKKSKQQKAEARFAADGSQSTVPGAAKKGVQLTVERRDVHYINVECKATPSVSPKKAIKTVMGLLVAKVPRLEVLRLKEKNKKIRGKGGLPADWSRGLDSYDHAKGGTAAMAKVRSKHKIVACMVIVSTPAEFDLKGHLTGVSIDLEDDNLLFEVKSLKCLEDNNGLIVLFGYVSALGLD